MRKPKPLREIYVLLLIHENHLEHNALINSDGSTPSVNLAQSSEKKNSILQTVAIPDPIVNIGIPVNNIRVDTMVDEWR